MDQDKLIDIMKICSETKEENEVNESLKIVLKTLIGDNTKSVKELWFQANEIKCDANYYNLVLSLIDILYQNLKENKVVDIKKVSEDVIKVINNNQYSSIYQQTRNLFFKVDQSEVYYYDIFCSSCFLGFKKESPLNRSFIYNLKDLKEYDDIARSPYSHEIDEFNYDNIDEEFLQNLNKFMDFILEKQSDEKIVKEIIKKLKDKKRKYRNNGNNDFNIIKASKKEDNDINLNDLQDNNSEKEVGDDNQVVNPKEDKLINIQEDIKKKDTNNNLNSIQVESQKEDNNNNINNIQDKRKMEEENNNPNNKDIIGNKTLNNYNSFKKCLDNDNSFSTIPKENLKKDDNDKTQLLIVKNEKNKLQDLSGLYSGEETSNNEETEIGSNKKIEKEIDDDSYEKFFIKNNIQCKEEDTDIENIIMTYTKRMYRVNGIIILKSKIKQKMKEFCDVSKSQKDLLNYFCIIQENLINISILKSIINEIKPPVIFNIRRKFIDLLIFWIIKKNSDKFKLDTNYSPKSNYLDKLLKILQKIKKEADIENTIKFISNLKIKDISTTSFPMKISDDLINSLFSFLNFYKGKCSRVVHIGKEGLKYYNLYVLNPNYSIDTHQIFKEHENTKEIEDIKIIPDNKIIQEKNSMIDIEFVFKFLFDSNYGYQIVDSAFEDKLKCHSEKKKLIFDSPIDFISQSFNKTLKTIDKSNNLPDFELNAFKQEEQNYIQNSLKDFNFQISSLRELIIRLPEKEKEISEYKKTIDIINKEIDSLMTKEFLLNDNYYYNLDQKKKGRIILFYFQYKVMKLRSLYEIIEECCKNYSEFLEKSKTVIKEMSVKLKLEEDFINKKVLADNSIQSGNDIFQKWKKKKNIKCSYKYKDFIDVLRITLKGISFFKIDDDIIEDQITSCWLVKTGIDAYVLN